MWRYTLTSLMLVCISGMGVGVSGGEIKYKDYRISGPYDYKNLSLFLIHGADRTEQESPLTLQEALLEGLVTVHETGNVNELMIESNSDRPIFIQAGDIVKGGRQDRVLRYDIVLHPNSGQIPLAAFCVESGRWSQRADESAEQFESSGDMVAFKSVKLAAGLVGSQAEVWSEIERNQDNLEVALNVSVRGKNSPSSLQLTQEHDEVLKQSDAALDSIMAMITGKKEILGFAYALNGKLTSADIYNSSALFAKLRHKLFRACTIEALSHGKEQPSGEVVSLEKVVTWLTDIDNRDGSEQIIGQHIRLVTKEHDSDVAFETYLLGSGTNWVHKNVLRKD